MNKFRAINFYLILSLHMLIGGVIALSGIISFRPYFTAIIILLSIFFYKIKIDGILKFHILFIIIIIFIGVFNSTSISQILIGLRIPIISYSMYLVVDGYLNVNVNKVEKLVMLIAFIQLPIVVIQFIFYSPINSLITNYDIIFPDIRFGTFFVKSDPVMSTFLILVVIYLLFVRQKNNKWSLIVVISSCLSVLLADSRISQIVLLLILGYYFILGSTYKQKVYTVFGAGLIFIFFFFSDYFSHLLIQLGEVYQQITFQKGVDLETFKEGEYARGAAILYFLSEPLKLIGEGPGSYVNPLTNEMELGLHGEYFKMYAELGLVGVVTSLTGIMFIVFNKLKKGSYRYLIVITVIMLGITSDIYSDASLMFILYLMIYVIFKKQINHPTKFWIIRN